MQIPQNTPMDKPEITLEITPEGLAACPWWTPEAGEILAALGPPAPGFEEVNQNPWCG